MAGPDRAGVDPVVGEVAVVDGAVLVAEEPIRRDRRRDRTRPGPGRRGRRSGGSRSGRRRTAGGPRRACSRRRRSRRPGRRAAPAARRCSCPCRRRPRRARCRPRRPRGCASRMPSGSISPTLATPSEARTTRSMPFSVRVSRARLVAEAQPGFEVGRARRVELVDRVADPLGVVGAGRWQDHAGVVAERDDRDRIVAFEPGDQLAQGVLHDLEAALALHRTRGVDDEGEGGLLAGPIADVARLDAEAEQQLVAGEERGRAAIGDEGERVVALRSRIVLVEGVDPLLDPNAGGIGPVAVGDVALGDGVRGVSTSRPKVETRSSSGSSTGLTPGSS